MKPKRSEIQKAKKDPRLKSVPKSFWKSLEKIGEDKFSSDPLERCHLRWFFLFDKVLKILFEKDPNLVTNIRFTLNKAGLHSPFEELNPSDETLRKAKAFHGGQLSSLKLRGKQKCQGVNRFYPIFILHDYLVILSAFEDLREVFGKLRNRYARLKFLRDKIPKIKECIVAPHKETPIDDTFFLEGRIPKKELAVRLLAHFYGLREGSIRRYLTRGKSIFSEYFEPGNQEDLANLKSNLKSEIRYRKSKSCSAGLDLESISNWVKYGIEKEAFQYMLKISEMEDKVDALFQEIGIPRA
jgi:hypothetical protein